MTLTRALAPLLLAALALTAGGGPALASGAVLPSVVFVSRGGYAIDAPPAYAADQLGILQTGFDGRRLFITYRRLMGRPLTAGMMAELAKPCCTFSDNLPDAVGAWTEARKAVPGAPPLKYSDTDPYRTSDGDPTVYVPNCASGAFRTAAAVLGERIAANGADVPTVRDWLAGQDQVFRACSATDAPPPADAPPDAPAWLRADRAYQQAAAALYRRRYGEAAARFTAIAADTDSPWRESAPYLIARARAVADPIDPRQRGEAVEAYRTAAGRVLDDPALANWRDDVGRLDALVAYHAEPLARARALEAALLAAPADAVPVVEVDDLVTLARRHPEASDFTAWVATLRKPESEAHGHALARWRATGAAPWLVAALMAANAADAAADEVLATAATIGPDAPAYLTVSWHRVRLLIARGARDEARAEVERVLALPGLDPSTRNQFSAHGLALARSLEEFAAYAPRRALFVHYSSDDWMIAPGGTPEFGPDDTLSWRAELKEPAPHYLDADAAAVANAFLPTRRLAELARIGTLPAHIGRDLTLAAWTRAALLDDMATARALGADVKAVFPELAGDVDAHARARDGARRRFLAAFILLKLPGASPQVADGLGYYYERDRIGAYGPRWWEGAGIGSGDAPVCILRCRGAAPAAPPRPPFLSDADAAAAEAEAKALDQHADAPGTLGKAVLDWARANPGDPRVPEALHLVVRATRYVHTPSDVSKRAFQLLHKRHAKTPWAGKTPYWY